MRTSEPRPEKAPILLGLAVAVLFEANTLVSTQDRTVRAASPWRDDPYNIVVSIAQATVPVLVVVLALRLTAWRATGADDRVHQMVRAAGVLTAEVLGTAGVQWVAVAALAHRSAWTGATAALISGLAATTAGSVALTLLLIRQRRPAGSATAWRHDWLGDLARLPVLRRWATPARLTWVRLRAVRVFCAGSVLGGLAVGGATSVAEGWTDPVLICWAVAVVTAWNLALCLVGNAVAGFVARPARSQSLRATEAAVVAGCLAVPAAVAFCGSLRSAVALAGSTLGAGLAVGAATASALLLRLRFRLH